MGRVQCRRTMTLAIGIGVALAPRNVPGSRLPRSQPEGNSEADGLVRAAIAADAARDPLRDDPPRSQIDTNRADRRAGPHRDQSVRRDLSVVRARRRDQRRPGRCRPSMRCGVAGGEPRAITHDERCCACPTAAPATTSATGLLGFSRAAPHRRRQSPGGRARFARLAGYGARRRGDDRDYPAAARAKPGRIWPRSTDAQSG
jgi:hypothetical protein